MGGRHDGTLLYGVRPLTFPTLISVKHHVVGYPLRVLASSCVALLCMLVWRLPYVYSCSMIVSIGMCQILLGCRCYIMARGHVEYVVFYVVTYCPYMNFNVCEICASIIHLVFQKRLEPFRCSSLLENHFVTYENVFVAWEASALCILFQCSF